MNEHDIIEKELEPKKGVRVLLQCIIALVVSTLAIVFGAIFVSKSGINGIWIVLGGLGWIVVSVLLGGLKVVKPNEAIVLTLFGKYYGTIKQSGMYYVNPFCSTFSPAHEVAKAEAGASVAEMVAQGKATIPQVRVGKAISLKTQTLDNGKQKVNDVLGNPIIIGAVVIWRVTDPTRAVFAVENYKNFLGIQTDSTIRNTARMYPYDVFDENEEDDGIKEKTLRSSAVEIAEGMKKDLQKRVEVAGLIVEDVRITHLAYAEEIAAAMLQRQQAVAVIAARQKIVDGAVGMVKMAIDKLGENEVVVLDDERKVAMASNLLVVLCGNKDAQPVLNSGSIY